MYHSHSVACVVALVTGLPLLNACGPAESKKLSAEHVGDLSYVLGGRARPDADRMSSCGDGAPTAAGSTVLLRRPYLQQVTATAALVVVR